MSYEKPKPVYISLAMVGELPRRRRAPNVEERTQASISRPLNPRADSFHSDDDLRKAEASESKDTDVDRTIEQMAEQVESPDTHLSPAEIPLPDSDPEESYTPDSETLALQEALALKVPEVGEPLTATSISFTSPTYSDQGVSAWVWASPLIAELERWKVVKANLNAMELIQRSPHVPKNFSEWLTHRAEMNDIKVRCSLNLHSRPRANIVSVAKAKEVQKQIGHRQAMDALGVDRPRVVPAFGGATFEISDNGVGRSGVGAQETIWSPWTRPTEARPQADWPCQAEMKEEGDERNTSGFGRFPALPRVNGNATVNYKHKRVIAATPLDTVWPPPNPRIDQSFEELDGDYALHLIGNVLGAALDAD